MSSHAYITAFVNVCDVKSANIHYVCQIVNHKKENSNFALNMTNISSGQCLGSPVFRKRFKIFIFSRKKLNYMFDFFDKLWIFSVIYLSNDVVSGDIMQHIKIDSPLELVVIFSSVC